jgi:hypothetical protein
MSKSSTSIKPTKQRISQAAAPIQTRDANPTDRTTADHATTDRTNQSLAMQQSCQNWLTWALDSLNAPIAPQTVEQLTALIWSTVTGQSRIFHNFEHILKLAEGDDPIGTLAALFHDSVYVQVDWGLVPEVGAYLTPFLVWQNGTLCLRSAPDLLHNSGSACVALLFGLDHDEPLPAERFNEFLSALLAVRCLKDLLSERQLAEVAVAIEATIPFRSVAQFVPAEQLFDRLTLTNQRMNLGMTPQEIERAIHRSVEFANRDVDNFCLADPVIFLDQTWQLLPEFNPALRDPSQYSIRDYRAALRAMEAFLIRLDANQIFQQFRQVPNPLTCKAWKERAQHNLAIARLYLSSKLVAIAILEALASRREQKRPLSDWLGSLERPSNWEERFSAPEGLVSNSAVETQVLQIAEYGRTRPCSFDLVKSPFAAFLIRSMGFDKIIEVRPKAEAFFNQELTGEEFLELVPYFDHTLQL